MAKVVKDLIGKLDREEITNLQCITMHGKEMVDDYKEWCQVLGFDEGDEDGAEQFINELRYGDEPDDNDWPQEVWDKINEVSNEALEDEDISNDSNQNKESNLSSVELFQEWRKDKGKLDSLKTSENAVKITLWRYQNPLESKKACARALNILKIMSRNGGISVISLTEPLLMVAMYTLFVSSMKSSNRQSFKLSK